MSFPGSALTHLQCSYTGEVVEADRPVRLSPAGKVLFARYDLQKAMRTLTREALRSRPANMWRYAEIMPVRRPENVVTLGEGYTPILTARRLGKLIGSDRLFIKDEGVNPTGSFKARPPAAVSRARELGLSRLTLPSAGNAAGAMSAYCAAAGMEAHVFMPKDAPIANQQECVAYGARLTLVDGFITDAGKRSAAAAEELGLFDVSTLREPYRAEGKKTMGLEIAEQFDWELPDVIVYPTGGGTGIVGMWKAFEELEQMGWIGSKRPRMIVVQSEGCAPLVRAFEAGKEFAEPFPDPRTLAAGIRVPAAIGDYLILRAVRASGGTALTVSDTEILDSVGQMARTEGILGAPEGGATVAGLKKLRESGKVARDERVLLINTGSALKYMDVLGPVFERR